MRALIAGIGQPWQRDLAFGSHVVSALERRPLPEGVDTIDLSFGPITAFQIIRDRRYDRIVFVTARNAGRPQGTLYEEPPRQDLPPPQEIHARIGDCVMGCIDLDSLVILCRFYDAMPAETSVIEIEPIDETWGPELSDGVAPLVEPAVALALSRACQNTYVNPASTL